VAGGVIGGGLAWCSESSLLLFVVLYGCVGFIQETVWIERITFRHGLTSVMLMGLVFYFPSDLCQMIYLMVVLSFCFQCLCVGYLVEAQLMGIGVLIMVVRTLSMFVNEFSLWSMFLLLTSFLCVVVWIANVSLASGRSWFRLSKFMVKKYSPEMYSDHMNQFPALEERETHLLTEMNLPPLKEVPMIFITGYYRSGTTFLYGCLQSILPVCSVRAFDVYYFHRLVSDWQDNQREAKKSCI